MGKNPRRGFSFTEILFAVMILGIGFIMVAAVFPVAIKQTEEVVEETTGSSVAKSGSSYMQRIGVNINFPVTAAPLPSPQTSPPTLNVSGTVVAYSGWGAGINNVQQPAFWQLLSGNLILATDSRFAFVPFYSRGWANGVAAPYAQITVIAVQNRNGTNFTSADLAGSQPNLQGRALTASFNPSGNSVTPDTITFSGAYTTAVAEGTYVIVANDSNLNHPVSCNGYVYRVGNFISGTTWELMPGGDMKNARYMPNGSGVQVFVVGRGFAPGSTTTFSGPAMDIGAFSSFIRVH